MIDVGYALIEGLDATFLIDAGIDVVKVSHRLGHARPSITADRYAHLLDRREEAILSVLSEVDADPTRANAGNALDGAA